MIYIYYDLPMILMNTSLFQTRSHLSPNLAITISISFAVSVHTSIPKQPPLFSIPDDAFIITTTKKLATKY